MTRAMERLTLTHSLARTLYGRRDYNAPSRFLDELPAEVERERLRPASWSAYGAPRESQIVPRGDVPSLQTGDSVRHGSLGGGGVLRVEGGGGGAVVGWGGGRAAGGAGPPPAGRGGRSWGGRPPPPAPAGRPTSCAP